MAVIDLWYLKDKGPSGKRERSKRHGRGRRYRVDYTDAAGEERSKSFDHWNVAKDFDAACRTGTAPEVNAARATAALTFRAYVEQWRSAREFSWELATRKRIPGNIEHHLVPAFSGRIAGITRTDVLQWISNQITDPENPVPKSSMRLYYGLFNTIMRAAEIDKKIDSNPCKGIKLASVFKGIESRPRWVPTEEQVLDLFEQTQERYHVALVLGSNQALRLGEALAIENSSRCLDFDGGKMHVVQQLGYDKQLYGGFFLKEPKCGSSGTIDFDTGAMGAVQSHLSRFGTTKIEVVDAVDPNHVHRRTVELLISAENSGPMYRSLWFHYWVPWRDAAGWPATGEVGGFHALRHFCAAIMLMNFVDPQAVQAHLRHALLQTTLATYSHWLPRKDRPKDIVSKVLAGAVRSRAGNRQGMISSTPYPALTG